MRVRIDILVITLLFLTAGCEDKMEEKVKFGMTAETENAHQENNTLVVKKNSDVVFRFSGNPDFITFYSGEPGREYKNRDRGFFPAGEAVSEMSFSSFGQYGTVVPEAFRVYLSTTFEGLSLTDKKSDSVRIRKHQWIDISDMCNLPSTSSTTLNSAVVPLGDYHGKELTVAFVYRPVNNTTIQPTWEIQWFKITNTSLANGKRYEFVTSDMEFAPIDMYAREDQAYLNSSASGMWNLSGVSDIVPKLRIQSSGAGTPLNEDWLVSKPFTVTSCLPDRGTGIKNIADKLDSFAYKYEQAGEYTAVFVARNHNIESSSESVKEIIIKVID